MKLFTIRITATAMLLWATSIAMLLFWRNACGGCWRSTVLIWKMPSVTKLTRESAGGK